jgi:hypothetical protein
MAMPIASGSIADLQSMADQNYVLAPVGSPTREIDVNATVFAQLLAMPLARKSSFADPPELGLFLFEQLHDLPPCVLIARAFEHPPKSLDVFSDYEAFHGLCSWPLSHPFVGQECVGAMR